MKNKWLNIVLRLTNNIYGRKQVVIGQSGLKAVAGIIGLIIMEILLSLISLPLYLALSPKKVMAYFAERGSYAKVNFDYSLRRILTITGVGAVALVWAFKLALIVLFPAIHGPLQLYSVSGLQPADILGNNIITAETGIQTARIVSSTPKPRLTEVRKVKGGNYSFFGQGQPYSTVVLLLTDVSTAVYTAEVGKDGLWQVDHNQANFKLSEGNHSVVIFQRAMTLNRS